LMHMDSVSEEALLQLRSKVSRLLSSQRFAHTVGVEREVVSLCALFAPLKTGKMRAAALLHDITKEWSFEKQLEFCAKHNIEITEYDRLTPKILHSMTAATAIPQLFAEYNDPEITSAVRWHTTGRENMSLCDIIVYLADYIEDTRSFYDCVRLRQYFYDKIKSCSTEEDKYLHLYNTLLLSYDLTIKDLIDKKRVVAQDTFKARNSIILQKLKFELKAAKNNES